jgi:hypothetical protein
MLSSAQYVVLGGRAEEAMRWTARNDKNMKHSDYYEAGKGEKGMLFIPLRVHVCL